MARKAAAKKPIELPTNLKRALSQRKAGADSEALLNDLIEIWGGTKKLALDLYKEFQSAGSGGQTRQRILEMIQRLIITNTNMDLGRTRKPSDMTDEELEGLALEYVGRLGHAPAAAGPE